MALPVVKQCCCGCSLESGSKIFAWLQIVGGVLMVIGVSMAAVRGGSESSEDLGAGSGSSVSQLVSGILSLILGVVLLMGIQKKRPDHINAWVIINLIGIVLYIICAITMVIMVAGDIPVVMIIIIISAIQIALSFYSVVVVSSLRKEIEAPGKIGV